MVFSMPTYFNPVGKERRRSVHQYSSGTLNLPKAVMIINSQMLWVLWNTLPILWGNNYFRINQSFLIQTLFIIFWSTPWNATLNTNFSLIGLMETISLFSKNLLSEWNLNILLFFCLVNHWFFFFFLLAPPGDVIYLSKARNLKRCGTKFLFFKPVN